MSLNFQHGQKIWTMNKLKYFKHYIREAFQSKKQRNLGIWPLGVGGQQKIKKVPSFSWEKFKNRGGGFRKSKKSQVPEGIKD